MRLSGNYICLSAFNLPSRELFHVAGRRMGFARLTRHLFANQRGCAMIGWRN
jgi:hypothetical protein